jgi:integrase
MIRKVERADGTRHQVYGRRNGKQVYIGTYDSKTAAKAAEEDFNSTQRKIDSGELPPELDTKLTITAAADRWLEALAAGKSRSHRSYGEFCEYQIKPLLGETAAAMLRKSHVQRWTTDLLRRGYKATTINSALGCLSSLFSWLVDQEIVASNPCHGVAALETKQRAYNWIKTRGELEKLLGACSPELRDMIAVAVGTGVRIDELLHLQWVDIDLGARLITVQRGRQGTPKSGKVRHIPILDSVLPVLRQRALQRGGATLVFTGQKGVRNVRRVQRWYKAALKRAGLDTTLRFHDLRHTCASWWVIGGGDLFRLSKLLGHSDVRITQRTYAHLAPEAWQQDYSRLAFTVPAPSNVVALVGD